jgi:hypothetical protein
MHLVGFKITNNQDLFNCFVINSLQNFQPRDLIYTTILYNKDINEMKSWYNKKNNNDIYGYIYGLYIKNKIVIAEIIIEGKHHYITLSVTNGSFTNNLLQLKKMANSGEMDRIDITPKFKIQVSAYFS